MRLIVNTVAGDLRRDRKWRNEVSTSKFGWYHCSEEQSQCYIAIEINRAKRRALQKEIRCHSDGAAPTIEDPALRLGSVQKLWRWVLHQFGRQRGAHHRHQLAGQVPVCTSGSDEHDVGRTVRGVVSK